MMQGNDSFDYLLRDLDFVLNRQRITDIVYVILKRMLEKLHQYIVERLLGLAVVVYQIFFKFYLFYYCDLFLKFKYIVLDVGGVFVFLF